VFRVLEVGIGKDCRLFRRRLYDEGLSSLQEANRKIDRVDITGIDLRPPGDEALAKVRQAVAAWNAGQPRPLQVDVQVAKRSVTSPLHYEDGYFDCVICCLTLCSVDDLELAVKEMYRLIRPSGGTFGYLEHVAVNPDEPYRWLELQQKALDPLQQLLVDNCHLHRYTEQTIEQAFAEPGATQVFHERFLVDNMWPVTCQCCGVYQRTG
jgi:SAM-dependent methyltransferase